MLRQAIGDAFRVTRNTPWTSFAIVLTLSLGTGLNAAVFALTYGIFFRPLPYRDPAALVRIDQEIPLGQLQEWQARLRTVDRVAAFASAPHVLRGIGAPHSVRAAFVSDEFFEVLGVQAGVGRTLGSSTGPAGVMLSRRAASVDGVDHEAMLGRPLTIAGLSLPVLGIMPASVSFPSDGLAGAARGLAHSLFGVRPYDPLTFGGIAVAILVVALLACLIPATRASRIDPAEVLRSV